ncbi:LecA/PA-IL family lectin, partial [Acidobacteriota bacterium]
MSYLKKNACFFYLFLFFILNFWIFNFPLFPDIVEKTTLKVYANKKKGNFTKLIIKRGDIVTIQASGKWYWGIENEFCCTAKGILKPFPRQMGYRTYAGNYGSLIGKINKSYFPVGERKTFLSDVSGKLYLLMNDGENFYDDNSGYFNVTVSVSRASKRADRKKNIVIKGLIENNRRIGFPEDRPELKKVNYKLEIYKIIIERECSLTQPIEKKGQNCIHGKLHLEITRRYKD